MEQPISHSQDASFSLRLFGPFEARIGGVPIPPLRTRKGGWLLALLTLRHGRAVEREWLAGTLWAESSPEQAFANLRRSLTDLRRALGVAAPRLLSPSLHTLALNMEGAFADVLAFDALIAQRDEAALEQALALYGGALLEGCAEDWALTEREAREQALLTALETLAETAQRAGAPRLAEERLRRAISLDPLRESAYRTLMRVLAAEGNRAGVALVYRDLRLRLRREMNVAPDPETVALFRRLQEEAQRNETLPPVSSVRKEAEETLGRLPRPLTSFVGREKELDALQTALRAAPWITLVGTGGVGKTRLAVRVAERTAQEYPDGVWFVDLSALTVPALLPQTIARTLDVNEQPGRPLLETLLDYLGSKRLLLVLDNCERLTDACAEFAERLLASDGSTQVLATSRQVLRLSSETLFAVPPLALPDPRRLPPAGEGLAFVLPRCEAIRLLAERATEATPLFTLTEQNAPAALQIARLLDGLPLAIELAAARVRMLSLEQVAARLRQSLRLLTRNSPLAPSRQQTLRAAIDWSHDLLAAPERALLRRLSVFAGGWTLEAAEAICGAPPEETDLASDAETLEALWELIEKSLVMVVEEVGGARRYRLLETIREYAQERLEEAGEAETLRRRHTLWFFHWAEEVGGRLRGAEQALWAERLEADHDNLRVALEQVLSEGAEGEARRTEEAAASPHAALEMAGTLAWFWHLHGHFAEGRTWLHAALNLPGAEARTASRAKALSGAGLIAWDQSDYPSAQDFHGESLAIRRALGDAEGEATSLNNLGLVAWSWGDFAAARAHFEEGLAIDRRLGGTSLRPRLLNNLGLIVWKQGDYPVARPILEECLSIQRQGADSWGVASALNNLGGVLFDSGDSDGAYACFEESLTLRRRLDDPWGIACALDNMGIVLFLKGDLERSNALFEEGLALRRELGNRQGVAGSLENLGGVARERGAFTQARTLFRETLAIYRELDYTLGMIDLLESVAALEAAQERPERAARLGGRRAPCARPSPIRCRLPPSEIGNAVARRFALRWARLSSPPPGRKANRSR